MTREFDVVVVGAGGSGLAAAVSAAQHGARVLVLEKQPSPGGTTGLSIGSFTAATTGAQRAAGIDDSLAAHVEDAAQFAPDELEARNDRALREFFLSEAAETLSWLESFGLSFVGPHPEPPNRVARMHNVVPGGRVYIMALVSVLLRAGGQLICDATVTQLIRHDGGVVGVEAIVDGISRQYAANEGVILAAGDYSNNSQRIVRHKGAEYRDIEGINPNATGDGHALAEDVGAKMINMDVTYGPELRFVATPHRFEGWLPTRGPVSRLIASLATKIPRWMMRAIAKQMLVTWQHPEDSLFADGALLLNNRGARFVDETSTPQREIAVASQPDKVAYILLDGRLVNRYSGWPHFVSTAPDIAYAYVTDYQRLRKDITITGYTLEDVALRCGLEVDRVVDEVRQYNKYVAGEYPDRHGRTGDTEPLQADPWVLLGPLKANFTTTEGGASVNRQLQVLDAEGQPIPGLYAVGQNGLGGQILWGHGLHIAWALTSGRLAGRAVAGVES